MMRIKLVIAVLLVLTVGAVGIHSVLGQGAASGTQDDADRLEMSKQVATVWLQALLRGDVGVVGALSDVPFALDRKKVIESSRELEQVYRGVVARKGKRDLKFTAVRIKDSKSEIVDDAFAVDRVMVEIMIDDESVLVCVKPGDTYKVVGMSD